jgi:hypothetical protein
MISQRHHSKHERRGESNQRTLDQNENEQGKIQNGSHFSFSSACDKTAFISSLLDNRKIS